MNRHLKKIVIKGALLLLPLFLYYVCYNQYLVYKRQFKNDSITIYNAIDKSKKKTKKKKVIFGDSVGAQLYPNYKDEQQDFYSLTTSAPSSLVGIYVLLENFLTTNPDTGTEFYYVVHASSLDEHLRGKYTYNHFVKPFYTPGNMKHFTASVKDSIGTIPYWYMAQFPPIKISDWQPHYNFMADEDYRLTISQLYIEYLKKIDALTRQHHTRFHITMPIVRGDRQHLQYTEIKQRIQENGLDSLFSRYFTGIKYLPVEHFHTGSNHYLHPEQLGDNPLGI